MLTRFAHTCLERIFQRLAGRQLPLASNVRRRSRMYAVEPLESRTMLTVSLLGVVGTSLQINYTNAVTANVTFDVSLTNSVYTVTLTGDTFDQGNANGVTKTSNQLTFAASAYPEYLIDTENNFGNTTVNFSGSGATEFLSGWLLAAGSGNTNSFSDNITAGATFDNGLVVQGFQTANINGSLTVAESTAGGISAGSSNSHSLSIEGSGSGLIQVGSINLAAGVTITGTSGDINLTGAQLNLAGASSQTISAGGIATNSFFNTSGPSNLNLPAAIINGALADTGGVILSANGFIGGGDVTLIGPVSATTTSGGVSLGTVSTLNTFTGNLDTSGSGSQSLSLNGLHALSIAITGPGIDDSVSFGSDVNSSTGGMTFQLGATQTSAGLSYFAGNVTAATGDLVLPAASIDGFTVQKFQTPAANKVVLGSRLQLFIGGTIPGSEYTQFQYGQLNGGLNLNNSALDVQLSYLPALNASFTIFKNAGTGTRTGTFNGLPNNGTLIATESNTNTPVDFRITYNANGDIVLTKVETAPTVATAASASPASPVNGDAVSLSVLGADNDTGESSLIYTWSTTGTPPAAVSFTSNGTNAGKHATALFTKPGLYHLKVTIADPDGMTATSTVDVTINPPHTTVTAVTSGITPVTPSIILTGPISSLSVSFSADLVATAGGTNSVTNVRNWALTRYGIGVSNPISGITFSAQSPSGPYVAILTFTTPLIDGGYQLIAVPAIHDTLGGSLIGDANGAPSTNFLRNFYVGQNVNGHTDVAPVLSGIETTPGSFVGFLTTPITSSLAVFDADSTTFTSAAVRIITNYVTAQDVLGYDNTLPATHGLGITAAWSPDSGILTLTGTASLSNYRTALHNVTYHSTGSPPNTAVTRTVSFTVNDGSLPSNTVTRDLTVRATSVPPVLTGLGGAVTFVQSFNPVAIAPALVASSPDGISYAGALISFTNWQPGDTVTFSNSLALQHGFSQDFNANTASLLLEGNNTAANYQVELRSIMYSSVAGSPSETPRTATITVQDAQSHIASGSQTIQLIKPPVLTGLETTPLVYAANHPEIPPKPISAALLVTDADSMNLSKATVSISAGYQNTAADHDVLNFLNQAGITGSFDPSTGTLTLTGTSTLANYRTALRSVTFSASGTLISSATRTLTINATDDASTTSKPVTRNITVTTTNAKPVVSGYSGSQVFNSGSAPITIAPNLLVSDSDSAVLASATITFTNWQGEDRLAFTNGAALQHTFTQDLVNHTATLVLTGSKTAAQYQTTLRSVVYSDVAATPNTASRQVSIVVTDGFTTSTPVTGSITVQKPA